MRSRKLLIPIYAAILFASMSPPLNAAKQPVMLSNDDFLRAETACSSAYGRNSPAYGQCIQQQLTSLASQRAAASSNRAPNSTAPGDFITSFSDESLAPNLRDPHIDYTLNPAAEKFYVHIPSNYSGQTAYGLVVYMDSNDQIGGTPFGWADVLAQRQLLFIAPLGAGNNQANPRRYGLAVLAALGMMQHYPIDPQRVYVAGLSGGARVAGQLGFYQPDIFHGTIQSCGADFYAPVPAVYARSEAESYGVFEASADEVNQARQVRFVFITGSKDFRRGNILDIYNGGFARSGLRVRLFDIPGMGHQAADPATFNAALNFIEYGR